MQLPDCLHIIVWDYTTTPDSVRCANCPEPFRLATGEEVAALRADPLLWHNAGALRFGNAQTAVPVNFTLKENA
jgi:hypothetical protein